MSAQAATPAFDILTRVHDIPPQIFAKLDPTTLAIAACVSPAWRDLARQARGKQPRFSLVLEDVVGEPQLLAWAAKNLSEGKFPVSQRKELCWVAARSGALATLQWARANGCPWNEWTCSNAAFGGHLEVLKWARENDCKWDAQTCSSAAEGGHLEVLQWARKNGCDWNARTCVKAAKSGQLAVLQWARKNGCAWDKAECLEAAAKSSELKAWIETQPA